MSKIETIKVSDIFLSDKNPRKTFSQNGLNQLAKSIKGVGLINPITVRKVDDKYELIAGERRFKACKVARVEMVKATIVDVDDETAYRMMIIENLQREDVHPLEEAAGFSDMRDDHKLTIAQIAEQVGRSEGFVLKRMKLNDLIDPLRESFYEGHMTLQIALALSRIDPESQQRAYDRMYQEEGWDGYPTIKQIRTFIDRNVNHNLEEAPFDVEDAELYPEAGPCMTCPKRAGANPLLFDDTEDEDYCFDATCYNIKCNLQFRIDLELALDSDEMVIVDGSFERNDVEEEVIEMAKASKKPILSRDNYHRHIYSGDEEDYEEVAAFFVSGYDKGKTQKVYIKKDLPGVTEEKSPEKKIEEKIEKAIAREERKVELDREKIFQQLPELWQDFDFSTIPLSDHVDDEKILLLGMYHLLFEQLFWDEQKQALAHHAPDMKEPDLFTFLTRNLERDTAWWMSVIFDLSRRYIIYNNYSTTMKDKEKYSSAFLYETLSEHWHSDKYAEIVADQMKKREERKAKYEQKLETLKSKVD